MNSDVSGGLEQWTETSKIKLMKAAGFPVQSEVSVAQI